MLSVRIAFRNILAHRRRNGMVYAVVAGVTFFLFLFLAFSDGELENMKNGVSSFWTPYADIQVIPEDEDIERPLTGVSALARSFLVKGVKEAVPRGWTLWGFDVFAAGEKYLGFELFRLDPADASFRGRLTIDEGAMLGPEDHDAVLLHSVAARDLPIRVGDEITLVGKDYFGQLTSRKLHVKGFFTPLADNPNLYSSALVDPDAFAALGGYAPDEANRILLRLQPGADARTVIEALKAVPVSTPVKFEIPSEAEYQNGTAMVFGMVRVIILVMGLITMLITAFGIMNVVSVNLFDRQKEVGTYYCLGAERPFLLATYTIEIFVVNVAGAVTGLAVGLLAELGVNALHLTTRDPGLQVVLGGGVFTLGVSPSTVFWILGGVSLITVLTALFSLGKALNVSPLVAVKEAE